MSFRSQTKPRASSQAKPRASSLAPLLALLAVALFESLRSAYLQYRSPSEADWKALAKVLEKSPWPVLPNQSWLDAELRRFVPRQAQPEQWGRPDIVEVQDFWVLSHRDRSPWGLALREAFAAEDPPELITFKEQGPFALSHYRRSNPQRRLASLGDPNFALHAEVAGRPCRPRPSTTPKPGPAAGPKPGPAPGARPGARPEAGPLASTPSFRCPQGGRLRQQLCEINLQPRFAWRLTPPQDQALKIVAQLQLPVERDPQRPLVLRGHIGFHDFNARIRSDAALGIQVRINGQLLDDTVLTDAQGWALLEYPLDPSWLVKQRIEVELRLQQNARGAWYQETYRENRGAQPCFEFRILEASP